MLLRIQRNVKDKKEVCLPLFLGATTENALL